MRSDGGGECCKGRGAKGGQREARVPFFVDVCAERGREGKVELRERREKVEKMEKEII